ncbi:MAG TPA: M28 family metallopeptidase [Steroidobacteraceae bacterium]|nr:M28 family metallopeptidase [Steroidobacteraceae bacterium]
MTGWLAVAGTAGTVLALAAAAAPQAVSPATAQDFAARGQRAWEDVKVLADDDMEGRRAGTPGHRRAAEYVAKQFEAAGLAPGGDGGWFQPVHLESRTVREADSSLALVTPRGVEPLKFGDDAVLSLRGNVAPHLEAPLVFVGNGLRLPQYRHDDLAGLDLKGKVVVFFNSAPKSVPGAAGAHFGSAPERWKQFRAAGAVGVMAIPNPFAMDLSWDRIAAQRNEPQMRLAPPAADLFPGMQIYAGLNPARFARLLEGTEFTDKALLDKLQKGVALPHFDLKVRLRATIATDSKFVTSENVIGVLKGSDPVLAKETVALSAHLDHLGIAEEGEGDRLHNGAMDNASGVATLIDVARHLQSAGEKPKRSIAFAAVTAEELGLLGSRAFAEHPGNGMNLVADINSDMFLPLYPMRHLLVFGLDESTLGGDARAVAAELGLRVQSDPQPQRNRFIRSDQYSFIRVGVPSLALKVGYLPDSPEAKIDAQWFKERYHAPGDDLAQPVDFGAVGTYAEVMQRIALRVANAPQAPAWKKDSVFRAIPRAASAPVAAAP